MQPTFTWTVPPPSLPPTSATPRYNKALVLVGLGLLANAAVLLYTHVTGRAPDLVLDRSAFAQANTGNSALGGQLLGARGIYMMPAQLGPQVFGLYLMDVDSGTICVYRAIPDANRFRLMSTRSFKYDRFLEDFNGDSPRPREVQKLVEDQRQRQDLKSKEDMPTVDQQPKPDANLPDTPARNP
jgi:hypothetical protein